MSLRNAATGYNTTQTMDQLTATGMSQRQLLQPSLTVTMIINQADLAPTVAASRVGPTHFYMPYGTALGARPPKMILTIAMGHLPPTVPAVAAQLVKGGQ